MDVKTVGGQVARAPLARRLADGGPNDNLEEFVNGQFIITSLTDTGRSAFYLFDNIKSTFYCSVAIQTVPFDSP